MQKTSRKVAVVAMLLVFIMLISATSFAATPKPKASPTPPAGLGVIGRIKVANTKIDYDVVVATDNVYYMTRDTKGKNSSNGSIFMDYRNRDASRRRNIILYGHNMKSGAMFADIHKMKTDSGLSTRKKITFTLYKTVYEYEIFKVAIVDISKDNYTRNKFTDDNDYASFVQKINDLTAVGKTTYVPTSKDSLLSLVTCTAPNDKNGRLIAYAYRVK